MLQKKIITKKQHRQARRRKVFFYLLCGFLIIGIIILAISLFFYRNSNYLNPLSAVGYKQNTILESSLNKYKIDYLKIKFIDNYYEISLKDNEKVLISTNKNIEEQVSSLQLILTRLKIEGRRFNALDFRFDKPVIF